MTSFMIVLLFGNMFMGKLLTVPLALAWWLEAIAGAVILLAGVIAHRLSIRKHRNHAAELFRQVNERSELLAHSIEKERKAREEAIMANRTKSLLLARINHEIRTPLNGVLGMTSLLTDTLLNNEQKDYCDTIRTCGENLVQTVNDILLNDILEYSKVDSVKMELEQKELDLLTSIEDVFDVFAGKAAQSDVELLHMIDTQVPAQIIGDNLRIQQILMNLIENSVRHTGRGEIMVIVSFVRQLQGNTMEICFEITDTGAGITLDKLKLIQDDLAKPILSIAQQKNLGTGLLISKKLVELMGGRMDIRSTPGKGSSVKFNIVARSSMQSLRSTVNYGLEGLEGKKILVVEDNNAQAKLIEQQLTRWNLNPVISSSGKDALKLLGNSEYDLILTDMHMPEMDGIELSASIRELHPATPVVLMAAAGDPNGKRQPLLVTSVIHKPLRRHLLAKHIRHGLKQVNRLAVSSEKNSTPKLSNNFSEQFPLRILIAEDNPTNLKLATKVLNKLGYTPDTALNGKEVLEIVSQKNYDLILMDVQMPEMDGMEAARMIRLCLSVQPVIIAMTANTLQGDREDCLRSGMDDYISKPINLEELVQLLEKWAFHIREKR
jgi:CheY-like chemotaxis protein/signal transduction histidine kinase